MSNPDIGAFMPEWYPLLVSADRLHIPVVAGPATRISKFWIRIGLIAAAAEAEVRRVQNRPPSASSSFTV
jgi:hypothetical protein